MGIITLALIVANVQNDGSVEPQLWVNLPVQQQWGLVLQLVAGKLSKLWW